MIVILYINSSISATPEKIPTHKSHELMILKMPKTDHGGFDSTVSDETHDKTATEHIEDDEASYLF